ncbi:MAG: glycosyltransferase family 39 protein [Candidatus Moranbacteria bacterium]|nr:glycosyltransferase family 39 protein [Candidatus Moranbacteria bacterium]
MRVQLYTYRFAIAVVGLSIVFLSFGAHRLGKFETTDEHLWKYDRIARYWSALARGDWNGTYINDKPGVTVALISGIGLLSEPDPKKNEMKSIGNDALYEYYAADHTEVTNVRFRLPVLLFATASLSAFFLLCTQAFGSRRAALFSTALIALHPILLGMSQIINPDSFFWVFGGLSATAFLAAERTGKRIFVVLCGVLTGFALLSKYTAFSLFLFYMFALVGRLLFPEHARPDPESARRGLTNIGLVFIIAAATFALFLPASFLHPDYLFSGISQFFQGGMKRTIALLFIAVLSGSLPFIFRRHMPVLLDRTSRLGRPVLFGISLAFLVLIGVSVLNVWTGQRISPVESLRDASYANEPNNFSFKPVMDRKTEPEPGQSAKLFLMEAYPFVFSLTPILLLSLVYASVIAIRGTLSPILARTFFVVTAFMFAYLASTLSAKVITNVRYSILLYPLAALVGGLAIDHALTRFASQKRQKILFITTLSVILILGVATLWQIRPFPFSYTNILLPKTATIHDSWGHGSYEAAEYLNALPDAENVVIWSNSDTVCRFFVGHCLRSRKIDLTRVTPHYFVLSKRGVLKESNRFILQNADNKDVSADRYYEHIDELATWRLNIGGRPGNFVTIIPSNL